MLLTTCSDGVHSKLIKEWHSNGRLMDAPVYTFHSLPHGLSLENIISTTLNSKKALNVCQSAPKFHYDTSCEHMLRLHLLFEKGPDFASITQSWKFEKDTEARLINGDKLRPRTP